MSDIPEGIRFHPVLEQAVAEKPIGELNVNRDELVRVYMFWERLENHLKSLSVAHGVRIVIENDTDLEHVIFTWMPNDLIKAPDGS